MKSTKIISKNNFNNHAFQTEKEANSFEKKAETLIHSLTKTFLKEAKTSLSNMIHILDTISYLNDAEKTRIIQTSFFKSAHDLKGQGETYGYPLITRVAAHLCEQIRLKKSYSQKNIQSFRLDVIDMEALIQEPPHHKNIKLEKRIWDRLECNNE